MSAPAPDAPLFRPVADHALLAEFGTAIAPAPHAAVLRLDRALAAAPFAGFREAVPAYVNLLVTFDPQQTDHAAAEAHLRALLAAPDGPAAAPAQHVIPVCYDPDLAPDLAEAAARAGLSVEAAIAAHLAGAYEVFLYGFAPGYAYLAGVPPALRLDRKPAPVRGVPAGTVIVAGPQCLISTLTLPTGWWRIGATPARVLTGDPARPFLFDVGDRVSFRRIGRTEHEAALRGAP